MRQTNIPISVAFHQARDQIPFKIDHTTCLCVLGVSIVGALLGAKLIDKISTFGTKICLRDRNMKCALKCSLEHDQRGLTSSYVLMQQILAEISKTH